MLFTADDVLWMPTRIPPQDGREPVYGIQAFGPDGPIGDNYPARIIDVPEVSVTVGGRVRTQTPTSGSRLPLWAVSNIAPFARRFTWTPAGAGLIVAGAGDRYRFEVQQRGETVLVAEKYWEPVPIDPEHAEWQRKATVASSRRGDPDWTWDGSGMPEHHPAFGGIVVTTGGEFWVARFGPSLRMACAEEPEAVNLGLFFGNACWRNVWVLDAFDQEGRYLGEIDTPVNMHPFSPFTHVVGDRVIGVEVDDFGLWVVKRYRLVLPGER